MKSEVRFLIVLLLITSPLLSASKRQILENQISIIAQHHNLDSLFVKAVIAQESNYNPNAEGTLDEIGLMQLREKYFHSLGDLYNVEINVNGGCTFLVHLLNRFDQDKYQALTGYNYGPSHTQTTQIKTSGYAKQVMKRYHKACDRRGNPQTKQISIFTILIFTMGILIL